MFEDNFSTNQIRLAAQSKHLMMLVGSFPIGVLVDRIGHRAFVNAFTSIAAIIWWTPFIFNLSWVRWPMVSVFSLIDAAWVSTLYALPISMVPQEHMDLAMLIVNGIQWLSCVGKNLFYTSQY